MSDPANPIVVTIVLLLSAYAVIKFSVFLTPYARRRAALDKSYAGRAYATATSDVILLAIAIAVAAALLASGAGPISFLGGLFVGATLIQLFFHAFHEDPPRDRQAPEPRSPLKCMSYAIQDRPGRAWREMATYTLMVLAAVGIYVLR